MQTRFLKTDLLEDAVEFHCNCSLFTFGYFRNQQCAKIIWFEIIDVCPSTRCFYRSTIGRASEVMAKIILVNFRGSNYAAECTKGCFEIRLNKRRFSNEVLAATRGTDQDIAFAKSLLFLNLRFIDVLDIIETDSAILDIISPQ